MIHEAVEGDFERLREIEVLAGEVFPTVGMDFIADMPPPLTTYRDLAWNGVYYEKIGFEVVEPTPGLAAREAAIGLDPTLRVCMRR